MKNSILPRGLAFAIAGLALTVRAQQAQYPVIVQQPQDQCIPMGSTTTYSVTATNATSYQWMFNGAAVDGATNSGLIVSNVTLSSVGYYSVFVYDGADAVPSRSAALDVYVTGGLSFSGGLGLSGSGSSLSAGMTMSPMDGGGGSYIVVYGGPLAQSGSGGTCPGKYSGYVNYVPPSGWGYIPSTNTTVYTATDTNASNTKIQYGGEYGDMGCAQTTVTVPYPTFSPQYRFAVYFPTNTVVPTNAYPIILTGFNYTVAQ